MEGNEQILKTCILINETLQKNNTPAEVAFSSLLNILIGISLASGIAEEDFNSCLTQARKHFKKMKREQQEKNESSM